MYRINNVYIVMHFSPITYEYCNYMSMSILLNLQNKTESDVMLWYHCNGNTQHVDLMYVQMQKVYLLIVLMYL